MVSSASPQSHPPSPSAARLTLGSVSPGSSVLRVPPGGQEGDDGVYFPAGSLWLTASYQPTC